MVTLMKRSKKTAKTLAIVGNGFDMAHGYKTDYKTFAEKTKSPYLDKFKEYCESEKIETWYLFEENIQKITYNLFLKSMSEKCDYDENRKEAENLTEVFRQISILLADYLNKETQNKPLIKNTNISNELTDDSIAINFNYTATAEIYTKDVIYVHGSLKENDILLGYDYRDEPCLAGFEDMRWSKNILRESLAFRRYYLGERRYKLTGKSYKKLYNGLESYLHWENTGRGLDDEVQKFIPKYKKINKFLKNYRNKSPLPELDYSIIETIVVLGHGIEADKKYLESLLNKCCNLNKVVIFRYSGETDESYKNKSKFFEPYCENIIQKEY